MTATAYQGRYYDVLLSSDRRAALLMLLPTEFGLRSLPSFDKDLMDPHIRLATSFTHVESSR